MTTATRALWIAAAASSLVLHGAVGMALYAMPRPAAKPLKKTEISIRTLESRTAQLAIPAMSVSAPAPESANVASVIEGSVVAPADVTSLAPQTSPMPQLSPAATADSVRAVETSALAPSSLSDDVAPSPSAESTASPARLPDLPIGGAPSNEIAALADQSRPIAPVEGAADTSPSQASTSATVNPSTPITGAVVESEAGVALTGTMSNGAAPLAAPITTGVQVAATEGLAPAIPLASPATASAAPDVVQPARPGDTAIASNATAPASPGVALAAPEVAATPAPGGVVSSVDTGSVAPVAGSPVLAVPSNPAADPTPVTPTEVPSTQVAMLPRPDTVVGAPVNPGGRGATSRSSRVPIADFLVEQKDTTDCLLAVPAGVGLQEASIAAFSDAPEKVARLGSEFERRSGLSLRANTYAVSSQQCGALSFARDLAQYPNFPLRLTLSAPVIGSGQELAGVISGLRKDMLYLMVVDDEGKAELVQSYSNLRTNTMPFRAPMTLTSGPVSSAQLLVAIATDGPLRTVASRPGMPADAYFEQLRNEIIADQRSIAYGIVGFTVR